MSDTPKKGTTALTLPTTFESTFIVVSPGFPPPRDTGVVAAAMFV
jgi:hypothetical protein